jgi:hypothetical protein
MKSSQITMRPLVSLISVAAFLLHLGLGCCAHHAHGGGEGPCEFRTSSTESGANHGHSHDHSHDHSAPDSNSPEHPGDSHNDCHESHCFFLVSGKTTVHPDTLIAALPPLTLDASIKQSVVPSANWRRDTGDHLQLPVRLHLFHQVMLI